MKIERATEADYPELLRLNNAVVPHVNELSQGALDALARQAAYLGVVRVGSETAGFLMALAEGAAYTSPNFLWFKLRYPRFLYVDRIVVSSPHRRGGLGRKLYQDLQRPRRGALRCSHAR